MHEKIKKCISKLLRDTADKIENGTCELSLDEASDIVNILAHEPLSKESACHYLNVSRATFDNLVASGKIPKGKKRRGFKELVWYKDELSNVIKR